jgi:hypothetical protein
MKVIENLNLNKLGYKTRIGMLGRFGDPLCNPVCLDMIKYIRDVSPNHRLNISTNAMYHDEKWWFDLSSYLPEDHYVYFGIDGIDESTHLMNREGSNLKRVFSHMKAFIKGGGKAAWQFLLLPHNEHQVYEAEKIAKDLGCSRFVILVAHTYENGHPKLFKVLSNYEKRRKENIDICMLESGVFVVTADGYIIPCHLMSSRSILEVIPPPLMNLNNNTLQEIIDSRYFDKIIKNTKTSKYCLEHCCFTGWTRFSFNTIDIEKDLG